MESRLRLCARWRTGKSTIWTLVSALLLAAAWTAAGAEAAATVGPAPSAALSAPVDPSLSAAVAADPLADVHVIVQAQDVRTAVEVVAAAGGSLRRQLPIVL